MGVADVIRSISTDSDVWWTATQPFYKYDDLILIVMVVTIP